MLAGTLTERAEILWRQSTVADYLRCPRKVLLEHVLRWPMDHNATGYAAPIGTALHAGCQEIVECLGRGDPPPSDERLWDMVGDAFDEAIQRAIREGATHDPEGVDAALDRLEARLVELAVLRDDPRMQAIEWLGAEVEARVRDQHGRTYKSTIDAVGIARRHVREFGAEGRVPVELNRGELVVIDWKSGLFPTGTVERAGCVQLWFYPRMLPSSQLSYPRGAPIRTFIGALVDASKPVRPRDEHGNTIPSKTKRLNPDYVEGLGRHVRIESYEDKTVDLVRAVRKALDVDDEAAIEILGTVPTTLTAMSHKQAGKVVALLEAEGAKLELLPWTEAEAKRAKRAVRGSTKWIEEDNPAYVEACSKPRGPIFRECVVDDALAGGAVRSAIRGAELGLWPASGALNGTCAYCEFRTRCAAKEDTS